MRERLKYRICKFIVIQILFLPLSIYSQNESEIYEEDSKQSFVFMENKGQIINQNNKPNPAVLYLLNTPGMNVQLRKGGFSNDLYQECRNAGKQNAGISFQNPEPSTQYPEPEIQYPASQTHIVSPGAFQTIYGGGSEDAFLAKFTTGGLADNRRRLLRHTG